MPIAYLMHWTEYERGWGQRPDGYSLHATREAYADHLAKLNKSQEGNSDEFSRPSGDLVAVEVSNELAEKLAELKSIWYGERQLIVDIGETGARTAREKDPTPAPTFIDLCLAKKAKPEDIDDFIDRWHDGKGGVGKDLRDYLGMTKEEYAEWMKEPNSLYKTLFTRAQATA